MSHLSTPLPPSSPPPFAVVWPDAEESASPPVDSTGQPSLEWTLSRLYGAFLRPKIRQRAARGRQANSPRTIEQDEGSLVHWRRITKDPPLRTIDDEFLDGFVGRLLEEPGRKGKLAQNTVKKICTHLQWMLEQAGPPSRRNPKALRLFNDAARWPIGFPLMPTPPACARSGSNWFDAAEIASLWRQCSVGPDLANFCGIAGSIAWPTLCHLSYNVGLRIDTIMQLEWSMVGCPCGCRSPGDFVHVPPRIFKRHQSRPPFCLNRFVRAQLDAMRAAQQAAALPAEMQSRIIPWLSKGRDGISRPWPHGKGWLFSAFRRLLKQAKVELRRVGFSGFRAALCTWAETVHPGLAPLIAGHKAGVVTVDHYTHFTAVRQLMADVPQPGVLRQRTLFE